MTDNLPTKEIKKNLKKSNTKSLLEEGEWEKWTMKFNFFNNFV